jgi:hypothetical protein
MTTVAYVGLRPEENNQASAMLIIIVACSIPLIFLMRKSQAGAAMQGAA